MFAFLLLYLYQRIAVKRNQLWNFSKSGDECREESQYIFSDETFAVKPLQVVTNSVLITN